jgi:RimJ/RimL family protein N-acetyltransferase
MRAFDNLSLTTPRLLLRPLQDGDAPALFAMFSNPEVMRYWSTPPWTEPRLAHEMIERDRKRLATGEHLRLALVRHGEPDLIGTCSLFSFMPQCRRAEIGYGLAHQAWGCGLMHEALSALLDYAFGELGLHRLEADIDPRNGASARSLARLGFRQEGLLRERWIVDGVVSDTAFYGLLQQEWRQRQLQPQPA